jgi:hypothetical protein
MAPCKYKMRLMWMRNIFRTRERAWRSQCGVKCSVHACVKVKAKLSLWLTEHHTMKTYWESGSIASHILNLGTRWRWVVSFMPWILYPQGKSPQSPLNRRLGGLQSQSGCSGKEKKNPIIACSIEFIKPPLISFTENYILVHNSKLYQLSQ